MGIDVNNINSGISIMPDIINHIISVVLLIGACLIFVSYLRISRLVAEIPQGAVRKRWNDLRVLVLFFIAGYLMYVALTWLNLFDEKFELIVPAMFFLVAVLILFTGTLALETATEFIRFSRIERENVLDHLTGAHNRRYLDERIASEAIRAHRYDMPLSMMMIDIDHFKSVNDCYGHQVGDHVLKNLCELLIKKVRAMDVVARYGGEEIVILTMQTGVGDAFDLAKRLCRAVEETVMVPADQNGSGEDIRITVSIGVAGLDQRGFDSQTMVKKADTALYQAKREGRNRVIRYREEQA